MKVLFFDSQFPSGHKSVNNGYLRIMLMNNYEIYLCGKKGWFNDDTRIHQIESNWKKPDPKSDNMFMSRIKIIHNFVLVKKFIKLINPDIIYIASYDIISLLLVLPIIYKYRKIIFLQEHNNVDQLSNKYKRFIYKLYSNRFRHFVFESFIKDKLISYGLYKEMVFTVPHPMPVITAEESNCNTEKFVIGLSNSNSEDILKDLVNAEITGKLLSDTKYRFIVKSHDISYSDENLEVINGWISDADYKRYIVKSKFFFIPFSEYGYRYRVSNVFLEAIINHKKIISNKFKLAEFYSKKFPGLCKTFETVRDIPPLLNIDDPFYESSRDSFLSEHSDNQIAKLIDIAFKSKY